MKTLWVGVKAIKIDLFFKYQISLLILNKNQKPEHYNAQWKQF